MEELFNKAREFGRVHIHTHTDGTYSCNIEFNTIDHVELKAQSGYKHKDVNEAIQAAICNSQKIVNSLVQEAEKFKRLSGK